MKINTFPSSWWSVCFLGKVCPCCSSGCQPHSIFSSVVVRVTARTGLLWPWASFASEKFPGLLSLAGLPASVASLTCVQH